MNTFPSKTNKIKSSTVKQKIHFLMKNSGIDVRMDLKYKQREHKTQFICVWD